MTCATCAVRIERVLGKQEGVANAAVNLAGASASVQVTKEADTDTLIAAVDKIGYGLEVHDAGDAPRDVVEMYSE